MSSHFLNNKSAVAVAKVLMSILVTLLFVSIAAAQKPTSDDGVLDAVTGKKDLYPANADAKKTVEVEKLGRRQRVHVIFVVKSVEHFQLRDNAETFADVEGAFDAEVEDEESVVFAQGVATLIHAIYKARLVSYWLRRVRLHTDVSLDAPGKVGHGIEIKSVAFVAITVRIFGFKIE